MSIRDRNQDVDANILKLIRRLREENKDHYAKIIRLLYYLWFWPVCEDFLHVWSQKRIRKWFNFQHALKLCCLISFKGNIIRRSLNLSCRLRCTYVNCFAECWLSSAFSLTLALDLTWLEDLTEKWKRLK